MAPKIHWRKAWAVHLVATQTFLSTAGEKDGDVCPLDFGVISAHSQTIEVSPVFVGSVLALAELADARRAEDFINTRSCESLEASSYNLGVPIGATTIYESQHVKALFVHPIPGGLEVKFYRPEWWDTILYQGPYLVHWDEPLAHVGPNGEADWKGDEDAISGSG